MCESHRAAIVAGVVNRYGAVRTVVTDDVMAVRAHVEEGERYYIVPGLTVVEPVDWGMIPNVIRMAQEYARKQVEHDSRISHQC